MRKCEKLFFHLKHRYQILGLKWEMISNQGTKSAKKFKSTKSCEIQQLKDFYKCHKKLKYHAYIALNKLYFK